MPTGHYARKPPLVGKERAALRRRVVRRYVKGYAPIRTIAAEIGRSYGLVWTLLGEAEVQLRPPEPYPRHRRADQQLGSSRSR